MENQLAAFFLYVGLFGGPMVRTSDLRGQNRVLSFPGVRTRAKYGKKKKKTKNKKNSFVFALLVIKQYKNDGFLFFLMNV